MMKFTLLCLVFLVQFAPELSYLVEAHQDHGGHMHSSRQAVVTESAKTVVDLSYPLDINTLFWPTQVGFTKTLLSDGDKAGPNGTTYYLRSESFAMGVHCGTHLDAPRHFSKNGWTVDQIPLDRLIDIPIHVIDLSEKVKLNRTYSFRKDDFIDSSTKEPLIKPKSVVLVYTGISQFYSQGRKAYFGTETNNIAEMKIPGFSKEAAQYMVDQNVYGVGLDAPSADSSERHGVDGVYDPSAHTVLNTNNIYILENISPELAKTINEDMRLTIAPLAIVDGSGSPVRLVAQNVDSSCQQQIKNAKNSASRVSSTLGLYAVVFATLASIIALRRL